MKRWLWIIIGGLLLIGLVANAAESVKTTVELDARNVSSEETALGNFIADAVSEASGADIAVIHAMAFRANALIAKNAVVDEQAVRNILASPTSKITKLKLTPAVLRAMMERSLAKQPESNTAFLQFSGMTVTYDPKRPANSRVTEIRVGNKVVDLSDNKTTFTVAMPRELSNGAVGYLLIFPDEVIKGMETTDATLLEAVSKKLAQQKGTISPKVEERLVKVK